MNSKYYCYKEKIMSQPFPQSLQLWMTVLNDFHFLSFSLIMQCSLTAVFRKVVFHIFFCSHRFSKGLFQKALGKHEEKERECNETIFVIHFILILKFSEVILQLLYCCQFPKLTINRVKYTPFYFNPTAFQYHLVTLCSLTIVEFTEVHLVYLWCLIV